MTWLERHSPDDAISITAVKAASASERIKAAAAAPDVGKVLPRGGDQRSDDARSMSNFDIDTQSQRAIETGVSRYTQIKLDALANKAPDLLEKVKAGKMSAHRAAVTAGIVALDLIRAEIPDWNQRIEY